MSRPMKTGLDLEPPERRIGQAAHDFVRWRWARRSVVLTRVGAIGRGARRRLALAAAAARPSPASRPREAMRGRGAELLDWARRHRRRPAAPPSRAGPSRRPPLDVRPKAFLGHRDRDAAPRSLRDLRAAGARACRRSTRCCAIPARPSAARCSTTILHRFAASGVDPARRRRRSASCSTTGRECFAEAALPADVEAVWWPRFRMLAGEIVVWEHGVAVDAARSPRRARTTTEVGASRRDAVRAMPTASTCCPAGMADILDYKTGSSPVQGRRRTRCSRRSWRWKARCCSAAPSASSACCSRPTSPMSG